MSSGKTNDQLTNDLIYHLNRAQGMITFTNFGALDPSNMNFDDSGFYSDYTQSAEVTFNVTGSVVDGVFQLVKFTSDGSNILNFNSDFESTALFGLTDGAALAAGDYWFYMLASNGKIHVNAKVST